MKDLHNIHVGIIVGAWQVSQPTSHSLPDLLVTLMGKQLFIANSHALSISKDVLMDKPRDVGYALS
ncbi:MAG: hypothetical protein ACOYNL_05110 [Rickettsiales bacterium]